MNYRAFKTNTIGVLMLLKGSVWYVNELNLLMPHFKEDDFVQSYRLDLSSALEYNFLGI